MSLHPLAGVIHKLRNADFHLRRLETATREYLNSGSHAAIYGEVDPKDQTRGRLVFKVRREPPLEIAAFAGDILHNLRSALDYMVEELVRQNGNRPGLEHQFPICDTPQGWASAIKRGRIKGVSPKALSFIDGFQPYHVKPEFRHRHALYHLRELSNRDKHHMLAIAAATGEMSWQFVTKDRRVLRSDKTTEAIRDGGVLAEVPVEFVIDGEKVQLHSQFTMSIRFNEAAFASGLDVAATLQQIREFVGIFLFAAVRRQFSPLPDDLRLRTHGLADPAKPETFVMEIPKDLMKELL